jgi:hypothetical protein
MSAARTNPRKQSPSQSHTCDVVQMQGGPEPSPSTGVRVLGADRRTTGKSAAMSGAFRTDNGLLNNDIKYLITRGVRTGTREGRYQPNETLVLLGSCAANDDIGVG